MGSFVAAGAAAQGVGAVSGLLLTRWMDVEEYAAYTIAMAMVGAIAVLTKGGVRMGLGALLADHWPDRPKVADAVSSAVRTRFFISALTMPPIVALTAVLLFRIGASWQTNLVVNGLLVAIWWADMRSAVIDQVLNFDGKAVRVQLLDTAIAIGRLFALAALWFANAITMVAALAVQLATFLVRIPLIRKWLHASLGEARGGVDDSLVRRVRTIALRQVPVDVFTVFQAQAAIFFLTQSGGSMELATYGALGRLVQVVTPFTALGLAFFTPAFAKAHDRVVPRILGFALIGSLPAFALVGACLAAPSTVLFLLGPNYAGQTGPLAIFALCTLFNIFIQQAWSLVAHGGWNRFAWVRVPIGLAWVAVAPFVLPVDTAGGAFLFFAGFSVGTLVSMAVDLAVIRKVEGVALVGRRGEPAIVEETEISVEAVDAATGRLG